MIISHKFRTIFVHIPKCAGTSVRNMLTAADPECTRFWGWRWMDRHQRYGDGAHIPLIDLTPQQMEHVRNYTTVTLTRNPVSRFYSAVGQHLMQHKYRATRTPSEILAELTSVGIRYDPAYIHFCPQHYFIYIAQKRHIDHVFSMEDADWVEKLRSLLMFQGFPQSTLELPELNQASQEIEADPSLEDLRRIYQLYKRDFELLGYEPPVEEEFRLEANVDGEEPAPHDFSAYDEVNLMGATFRKIWPNI